MNKARALQGRNRIQRHALSLTLLAGVLAAGGCGSETSSSSSQLGSGPTVIPVADRVQSAKLSEQEHVLFLQLADTTVAAPATYPFALSTTVAYPGRSFTLYSEDPVRLPYSVSQGANDPDPLPTPFVLTQVPFSVPTFNFVDSAPRFTAFEQFTLDPNTQLQPNATVVNGGITLTLQNLQNGNSFTVGAGKPTGSNVTYAFDNVYTSGGVPVRQTYLGTARFNNGWRAVFHSEDRLLGLPFGQQKSEVNLRFVPPQDGAVNINDFVALPSTFNPANNETTTFQAGVVATGFGNATLNWTLAPSGPPATAGTARVATTSTGGGGEEINLPPTFVGSADITSGVANVTQLWDGKSSSGQALALGSYPYTLNVTVADNNTGVTQSVTANTTVGLSDSPELVILSGNSERAHAYSPSTADLEKTVVDPLLRKIFDADETYTIKATGLKFDGQRPNTIVAEIKSNVSGRTLLKTLTFNNTTQAFSGTFLYNEVIQPRPATTLYSTVAGDTDPQFETLLGLWGNLIAGNDTEKIYPGTKAQVGQLLARLAVFATPDHAGLLAPGLAPSIDGADGDPVTGQTPDDSKNFFQYGFEAITVSLKDATGALRTIDLQTLQRVGHAADVVVVNCHGSQNGELSINPNAFFATLTPKAPRGATPKQAVFLSCAALDLRDYNNSFDLSHFSAIQGGHPAKAGLFQNTDVDPDTGVSYNFTPRASYGGEAWFRSFSGQTILLGYNGDVTARAAAEATPVYRRHIAQGENAILAWLRSNREVGLSSNLGGLGWTAFNACAYDTNGDYYYIAFNPPSGNFMEIAPLALNPGDVVPRGIYKVPASRWSLQADDWSKPLQTSNKIPLASKVE